MADFAHSAPPRNEAEVPTDLLAGLLIERGSTPSRPSFSLPSKIYAVMALTCVSTFAALTTVYQLVFPHQLFA